MTEYKLPIITSVPNLDFFKEIGREIIECRTEEEAKENAQQLQETEPYPAFFFTSNTSGEKLYEEFGITSDAIVAAAQEILN